MSTDTKNQFIILNDASETIGDANDAWFAGIIAKSHSGSHDGDFRVIDILRGYKTVSMFRAGKQVEH